MARRGSSVWQRDIRVKYYETKLWDIMTHSHIVDSHAKKKAKSFYFKLL